MDPNRSDVIAALGGELNALLAAFRAIMAGSAAQFHADLQPAAYQIAVTLAARGASKAGTLAEKLGMDKSAVSRLAKSLCGAGLAAASPDPEDGRGVLYSLTDEGADRVRVANLVKSDAYFARIEGWSDEELSQFVISLRKFNQV
ncbi:MarR family winged helix-turn-helix transcriptional regulator [Sphingomonas sp. ERG5]|uniref:MarR family winged helix-turn-helix transcriptional regulator n=1 Tax=Sphingomonas sp. ERG5 TaxID=1381597 RepID=UPI00054BCA1B|nr:MarR family transcriptional regulator [Sphingomonas sp. ERG5]